jgi:predicted ribosome quality control (RQC) complex YloA/Tae2 family protein
MASKGKPYRKVDVEGFEVLIGRGARENDALTFGVGKPPDTWLHVAGGTPGSHVIIRNPEKDAVPRSVIERAARFAAWFSRKPKGAPAGLVQLLRYQKVRVRPEPPNADDDPAAASDQNEGSD